VSGESLSDQDDEEDTDDRLAVSETSELTEPLPSSSSVVGVSRAGFDTQHNTQALLEFISFRLHRKHAQNAHYCEFPTNNPGTARVVEGFHSFTCTSERIMVMLGVRNLEALRNIALNGGPDAPHGEGKEIRCVLGPRFSSSV